MIDEGLVDDWHPEVVAAAERFDQGDLVERPPFFYAAQPHLGVWATTRSVAPDVDPSDCPVIELEEDECPPYGVITSQGCDIADTHRKPWVQIAPVYPAEEVLGGPQRLGDVRRDGVPYLVLLDPPNLDGLWVADLRVEMPVEKSWLAGREPIAAFKADADRRHFARRLAGRMERPALHDAVHVAIVRPLRRMLDKANATLSAELASANVEFRLLVREHPGEEFECRLLVIARSGALAQSAKDAIESWWGSLPKSASPVALMGCRYCSPDEVSMSEYLASDLLDERHLDRDAA